MISGQTYILFVAPVVMGLGGPAIDRIADRFTRRGHHTPAERRALSFCSCSPCRPAASASQSAPFGSRGGPTEAAGWRPRCG
ncbi:hypothetical protein [Methylobacterium nigriterrae]|uniref:hypothetical protein n=1 Tax=Methylobacterium nigriterrae TaxID=3127512 RepID=UPI0030137373